MVEEDPIVYVGVPQRVERTQNVPYLKGQAAAGRPGWVDTRQRARVSTPNPTTGTQSRPQSKVICYGCYKSGHILPECQEDWETSFDVIMGNYHALTPEEKQVVPKDSYLRCKFYKAGMQAGKATQQPQPAVGSSEPSKN